MPIDTVGEAVKHEMTLALPQIATAIKRGSVARLNVEYFLRRAVRGHGTGYVKAAMVLRGMYHKAGMPPTMLASVKRELKCVCQLATDAVSAASMTEPEDGAEKEKEHIDDIEAAFATGWKAVDSPELSLNLNKLCVHSQCDGQGEEGDFFVVPVTKMQLGLLLTKMQLGLLPVVNVILV